MKLFKILKMARLLYRFYDGLELDKKVQEWALKKGRTKLYFFLTELENINNKKLPKEWVNNN